ncbi:MAG: hypothetical protein EOM13_00630 [Clostridia bacterium]|nr:hypothetical protein [Eubacteriales bacterium]MDD3866073.1 hypothetical protein [Eubacteriales bacterium]MDD4460883.1 hypothetical protein [Eubacteriales bacterium]NCC47547.1 hypothetical protein [Clostridia bacterium]
MSGGVTLFLFIVSLVFCAAITGLLLWLLHRSLTANRRHAARRPVSYLLPVFLSLIVVWFTAAQTVPRMLDAVALAGQVSHTEEIILDQDDIRWLSFRHNDQIFHYNRWQMMPEAGKRYRMRFTPYSLSVLRLEEVIDVASTQR